MQQIRINVLGKDKIATGITADMSISDLKFAMLYSIDPNFSVCQLTDFELVYISPKKHVTFQDSDNVDQLFQFGYENFIIRKKVFFNEEYVAITENSFNRYASIRRLKETPRTITHKQIIKQSANAGFQTKLDLEKLIDKLNSLDH
ncbi:unnamed protein product, partial [Brachionus calyciflorus]